MKTTVVFLLALSVPLVGCNGCKSPRPAGDAAPSPAAADTSPTPASSPSLSLVNKTSYDVTAFWAFGGHSLGIPTEWSSICKSTGTLTATCLVPKRGEINPAVVGILNATVAFGGPVGCGTTKVEFTINSPTWADTLDISLVDGYSNNVAVEVAGGEQLGPVWSQTGNERNYGVFPYGCDVCTAQKSPPCGIVPGGPGCKKGTSTNPDVVCQVQEPVGSHAYRVVFYGHDRPAME